MTTPRIDLDDAAITALLTDPAGPVGELIAELSGQAAAVARIVVHVRPGTPRSGAWSARSTARPPGFTRASIRVHGPVIGSGGGLYGGVNAAADPAVFLEYPAEQMYESYPFLTTALDSLSEFF